MHNYQIRNLAISVIIPVYNDPCGLKDTLDSLVNQDFPKKNYEIIVVDNGSLDSTQKVAKKYKFKYPNLLRFLVEDKKRGSYAARNLGIKNAKGKIIAFIDSDMTVDNTWLSNIYIYFKQHKVYYLACNVEIYDYHKTIFGLYDKLTGFPIENCINEKNFAPTCCLVLRKEILQKVKLFNSKLISGGDFEFGNRVYRLGYKLHYEPFIITKHPARLSFKQFFYKYFRIGRGFQQLYFYYSKHFKEMKRNLFNPIYFLPCKPWNFIKFVKRKKIWSKLSLGEKFQLYILNWLKKIIIHLGYIYEFFIMKE